MRTSDSMPKNCMGARVWDYECMATVLHLERQPGRQRKRGKGKDYSNTNAFCKRYGLPLGLPYQHLRSYVRHRRFYLELIRANLKENDLLNKFVGYPGDDDLKLIAYLDQLVDDFFEGFYDRTPEVEEEDIRKIMSSDIVNFIKDANLKPLLSYKVATTVEKKGVRSAITLGFVEVFREFLIVTNKPTVEAYDVFLNAVDRKVLPVFPDLITPPVAIPVATPVATPVETPKKVIHPTIFVGTLPLPTYFIGIPDDLYYSALTDKILGILASNRLAFRWLDVRDHPDFNAKSGYKYLACDLISSTLDDQIKKLISATEAVQRSDILKSPANVFKTFMERNPILETRNPKESV